MKKTQSDIEVTSLNQRIRKKAHELGFDACGITHAQQPETWQSYVDWIQSEKHGKMEYLRRHSEKKGDLHKVLSRIQSVISLAISYHIPQTT